MADVQSPTLSVTVAMRLPSICFVIREYKLATDNCTRVSFLRNENDGEKQKQQHLLRGWAFEPGGC